MAFNSINKNLERLEEQLFAYKPSLKSKEQKENVSKRLREQLLESRAVVKIQRMDAECENLMKSLKQRLMLLQDILIPKGRDHTIIRQQKREQQEVKLNLSSDSSDEETLSRLMSKRRETERRKSKLSKKGNREAGKKSSHESQQSDISEPNNTFLPLSLRREQRERKLSFKSISSSASTSHSRNNHNSRIQNRQEHAVSTSGVSYHSEELLMEQEEMDETPTLHIKIPSLHRGNVHYIILDSLDFARKVFDYRANEVKQQQSSITHTTKISKSHKKEIKTISSAPVLQQLTQQEQELELSQLIQDVMAEACSDETLQATNALENINNNLIDNYESMAQENFITYSQSSQEISYSQNSNIGTVGSTSNSQKKQRKNNKRTTDQHEHKLNEPARKRGRKPKKKNDSDNQSQPPTKTNLAKYVEFFANDCELMPGSTTPAASSTRSQPLVSSTTQNFDVIDQLGQHQEQQKSPEQHQAQQEQQSITYYIDGDWANGGPCQLVPTCGMSVDTRQLNQEDMNAPFQDFVNYIDNSGDSGNNVIARVLDANQSLPISIPLPIANLGLQNKTLQQTQNLQQSVPVINIQIPSLPNNITNTSTVPPPAHNHKEVLDLSVKSKNNCNTINSSNEVLNVNKKSKNLHSSCFMTALEEDCLPLDLSKKTVNNLANAANTVTIDNQDEEFIRRLIEQSEYQYNNDELKKSNDDVGTIYEQENDKSFKAALDMPLLDFDANDLAELVDNRTDSNNKQQNHLNDKIDFTATTNNDDSNYVSMSAVNSALHFSDHSTSDIFNKLLDICPDNQFLGNISQDFTTNNDLSESVFEQSRVENSTMLELEKITSEKNLLEKEKNEEICDTSSKPFDNTDQEPSLSTSTDISLAVQLDSSNNISNSSDVSIDSKFSFNENKNLTDITQNLTDKEIIDLSQDALKDSQQISNQKEPKDSVNLQQKNKDIIQKQCGESLRFSNTVLSDEVINLGQNSLNDNQLSLNKTEENKSNNKLAQYENEIKKTQKFLNADQRQVDQFKKTKKDINLVPEIEKNLKRELEKCNKTNDKIKNNSEKYKNLEFQAEIENKTQKKSFDNEMSDTSLSTTNKAMEKDKQATKDFESNIKITDTFKETNEMKSQNLLPNKKLTVEKTKEIKTYYNKSKVKENVVFSVAKITLSEDDHIFITDSDASSGKSLNVNDAIPNQTREMNIKHKSQKALTPSKIKKAELDVKTTKQAPKYVEENLNSPVNNRITNTINVEKKEEDTQMILPSNKRINSTNNEQEPKYTEDNLKILENEKISVAIVTTEKESLQKETQEIVNEVAINLKSSEINTPKAMESQETLNLNLSSPMYVIENTSQINEENDTEQPMPKENESCCSEVLNLSITSSHENNTESSTEDLVILNIDEEHFSSDKSQDVEHNIKYENDKNKDKNIEKNEDATIDNKTKKRNSKDLNENNEQLTLLELESKLEGSLDFEEDYDDTLSLATSCFDSPNDDRFEDSIIVDDSNNKPTTSIKPPDIQPITNITTNQPVPPHKDLKHFKIPKINQISSTENETVNESNTEKNTFSKTLPPPIPNQMPKIKINLEKITRTVRNDLAAPPPASLNQNCFDVLQPPLQNETPALVKLLQKVFGITCLPFLIEKCYALTHCQQSHQFNDVDTVYQILNTLDNCQINSCYQLMYNHVKLYKLYFQTFCTYYTNKHDRVKLLNMINDCERYPEYSEFMIMVYESLVNCGLSRVNACRLILKRIRETSIVSTIIEALVAIIMKSDWTMFTDVIEKYTQEVYKFNYRITTLEQMAPAVLNSKGPHLKQIFGKCVQTLHSNDTCQLLNSPILIQCVALLTTNT